MKLSKKTAKKVALITSAIFIPILVACAFFLPEYLNGSNGTNPPEVHGTSTVTPAIGSGTCEEFETEKTSLVKSISVEKKWVLIGKEFTADQKSMTLKIEFNGIYSKYLQQDEQLSIAYQIKDTDIKGVVTRDNSSTNTNSNIYIGKFSVDKLTPQRYEVYSRVFFKCGEIDTGSTEFFVSYPVYVTWTHDWEGYDVNDQYLRDLENLSAKHYNFPLTHFFNPYIYINGSISQSRRQYLTDWVKNRKANNGDSIGMHIHAYPSLAQAAGVTPQTSSHWGSSGQFSDGYDIPLTVYSYNEMVQILKWGKNTLAQNGITNVTTFRSGAWFVNLSLLRALQEAGFTVDSSGRTKQSYGAQVPDWDLQSTTQPYNPSMFDINIASEPSFDIYEFPDNGADSWAYTEAQIKQRFTDNYNGGVATEHKVVTFLSHPHWFYVDKPKMDGVLTYTDNFLYSRDAGPVVYINLDSLYNVWIKNNK